MTDLNRAAAALGEFGEHPNGNEPPVRGTDAADRAPVDRSEPKPPAKDTKPAAKDVRPQEAEPVKPAPKTAPKATK